MSIVIIGGGWSGLAAAVSLTRQGHKVQLLEAAKQLGGRARNTDWQGKTVDNGQHLMVGAYRHMLAMLQRIGADETALFQRERLDITIYDPRYPRLRLCSGTRLPWPLSLAWHMLRDNGFDVLRQLTRLQLNIPKLLRQPDCSVADWLDSHRQSPRLINQLWEPLCLATLNTPIAEASAQVFARVLREIFKRRHHSDLLIPKQPLGDVFPQLAAEFVLTQGGRINLQTRVHALTIEDGHVTGVSTEGGHIDADHVIVAAGPDQTAQLVSAHLPLPPPASYPICTVYLQYSAEVRLSQPVVGLSGTLSQWVFDRSRQHPGLIAVVISGPGAHQNLSRQELINTVAAELHQQLPALPVTAESAFVIREKRATFACQVDIDRQRPGNQTDIAGLWLAGDFIANPYPATLEGAVFNGEQTANQLMKQLGHESR